jgi:Fe-S-cluster containining protein
VTVEGCTGACCERFTLSSGGRWFTLEDVARWQREGTAIGLIALVVGLEEETAPTGERFGWFTCRAWDPQGRRCLEYDGRPTTCRRFPERRVCSHCGFSVQKRRRSVRRLVREWRERCLRTIA